MSDKAYDKAYWYARGYFDGRGVGEQARPDGLSEEYKQAYISGYNEGVTDFMTIQEENEQESE